MARKAAFITFMVVIGLGVSAGSSSGQLLDLGGDSIELPGDIGVELPGDGGGGGIDLPGGGGLDLPGDDGGGGVDLPGGGGVDLPGDDDALPSEPAPAPPPPDDEETGGGTGGAGERGGGGRRRGDRNRNRGDRGSRRPGQMFLPEPALRNSDGTPSAANPSLTIADFGPAPIGVPNFVIDRFTIPPFLLPIYQACATQYGVPWQVLAAINRIETGFGTNLNVSTAGAVGWMQFIPSSWAAYGVDANEDGTKDPYNPVDAICAAGRYLHAAGAEEDLRGAIFAYNHADWYVDEVLLYAAQYGRLPDDLVGSLTGLTEGARFPVAADARYADDIADRKELKRATRAEREGGNAARALSHPPTRRGINIYTRDGAPVIAVNDGVVTEIGRTKKLGQYLVLRDAYGNRFTYAELGRVASAYPVPRPKPRAGGGASGSSHDEGKRSSPLVNTEDSRRRLRAYPARETDGGALSISDPSDALLERLGYESFRSQFGALRFDRDEMELRSLREGSKVVAGTVLGRVGASNGLAPHVHFAIRPAGRGAPTIDPKPILDGWKLLEATHLYRASGKDPFEDSAATSAQVLLLSKDQAARELLDEPRISVYECGRQDIRTGQIDSRIMKLLLYLESRGFTLGVTSLKCGHSVYTTSGSVSHHTSGNAVDIAEINGLPVLGNQGAGSLTEHLVREVMGLQGAMAPDQIISLMELGGNTFAMGDHADHVHVGYAPLYEPGTPAPRFTQVLKPRQWRRLINRISEIENPTVRTQPSRFAVRTRRGGDHRASVAHAGE